MVCGHIPSMMMMMAILMIVTPQPEIIQKLLILFNSFYMCGLSEINVVSNRDGRLGWETDCDGRIRKGCNTKGPRQGDLL